MGFFQRKKGKKAAEIHVVKPDEALKTEEAREQDSTVRTEIDERGKIDIPYLVLTLLLTAIGLIMLFSASYARAYQNDEGSAHYFILQGGFAAAGIAVMLVFSRINHMLFHRLAYLILIASGLLLIMVLLFGTSKNGAKRWIYLGFTSFQPSEIVKFGIVLAFARMMAEYKEKMATFKHGVLPFALILGAAAGLLIAEPHLSATVIILILGAVLMFCGGTRMYWFAILIAVAGIAILVYLNKAAYANNRITAWLDPDSDPSDSGYQILQSLYAIGSGGPFGKGLGMSRQKYLYLPEEHNDYIFAIVCEELGLVGAVAVIILFALLICRGYWIAIKARDRFSMLTVVGLTTLLALQVFLNIGVVTNFLPPTGISLPFFSYGGTALMMQLFENGIVLSISRWGTDKLSLEKKKT